MKRYKGHRHRPEHMPNLLHTLKGLDERMSLCSCIGAEKGAKYSLLCHKNAKAFADRLLAYGRRTFTSHDIEWGQFDDGTDRIVIQTMQHSKQPDGAFSGHNILFVASFHNNADTLSQLHFLHYLCAQQRPASITILLPFFSTGTMERVSPGEEGYVPTAATLASMFSTLPFQGGVRVMTYDVHLLAEKFFFHGTATLTTHSAIPLLLAKLSQLNIKCVVFPDDGAKKRFQKLFNPSEDNSHFTLLACTKEHVEAAEGAPPSTDKKVKLEPGVQITEERVIIVDDMTRSGQTLFQCKTAILERTKGKSCTVSFFVTHGVFSAKFWNSLSAETLENMGKIYTTDAVMHVEDEIAKNAHEYSGYFEVMPLASQIIDDL
jgi:phosphoribosylpyrophosphate synthetase